MTAASHAPVAEVAPGADASALEVLRRHSDHSGAFLALNQETLHFRAPGVDGLVAYRPAGRRHLIQMFGPFAAPKDRMPLQRAFMAWSREQGRRVIALQLTRADVEAYVREGFVVNQLGMAYSIDLERFTLRGTKFFKLRNKLKRSARLGVTVEELTPADLERSDVQEDLRSIDVRWLRSKGRHVKELSLLIGERDGRGAPHRRLFLARHDGRPTAYVTYSPVFGRRAGWFYDLTRRHPDSPPGTVELIFSTAVERMREEECRWLHLGLTPLVGLGGEHEIVPGSSRMVTWLVHELNARGQKIYPARAQEKFKLKWGPHAIEPQYMAFDGRASLAAVWQIMRVTRAI